jgi:LDH2 family malate/lactate/ureidoglycolate dehydrogenase
VSAGEHQRGDHPRFPAGLLRDQITAVLTTWGVPPDLADSTAAVMVDTDLAGVDSHGIAMLPSYAAALASGEIRPAARPRVLRETAVSAVIDAGNGLGHPAAAMGMGLAVSKGKATGVGIVVVRRSHHFGAAGPYAAMAADAGLIGLVATTARTISVVPTRSAMPLMGTNPLALAAPAGPGRHPFLLDMSTSTVAVNKLAVYQRNAWPVPAGWVLDGDGQPLTDPDAALDQVRKQPDGGITPLGGSADLGSHKGYGLALAVQILAGTLAGATFAPLRRPDEHDNIGHFLMAVDPAFFREDGGFDSELGAIVDCLHEAPPTDPDLPVLVPGDPEAVSRSERADCGIPLPEPLLVRLREVCEQGGAPFLLTPP